MHDLLIIMTDKELQRLRLSELLEILLAQQKQIDSLKKELADANEQLAERKIVIEKSGSIAEAALKLNGIFEAAQRAADQYLYSIGVASAPEETLQTADRSLSADAAQETEEVQPDNSANAGASRAKSRKR